mgnify:CR=1 FL=1
MTLKENQAQTLEAVEGLFTCLDQHLLPEGDPLRDGASTVHLEESFTEWEELRDGAVWRSSPYLPPWLDFPSARQAVWHKRSRQQRYSVQYALSSLSPQVAGVRRLGERMRWRWGVEKGSFWVRDGLLREDHARAGGSLAFNHRQEQAKKAALEAFSFTPLSALRFLGLHKTDV